MSFFSTLKGLLIDEDDEAASGYIDVRFNLCIRMTGVKNYSNDAG